MEVAIVAELVPVGDLRPPVLTIRIVASLPLARTSRMRGAAERLLDGVKNSRETRTRKKNGLGRWRSSRTRRGPPALEVLTYVRIVNDCPSRLRVSLPE